MTPNNKKQASDAPNKGHYAIAETSGTQMWLEPNRYYDVDRINAGIDDTITLDKVLLINDEEGLSIGKPFINGANIELKVMAHKRGPKIIVYKMQRKKKTRRKNGHRQELTRVMVTSISKSKKTNSVKTVTPKKSKVENPLKDKASESKTTKASVKEKAITDKPKKASVKEKAITDKPKKASVKEKAITDKPKKAPAKPKTSKVKKEPS
ncbi:LSU ribosomal protein L21p [Prochlorococcus sp. MIT 0602]|nr:LSU ribosomal protein L21p [Prochlorococcus sp. MIT 0603]KGG18052.1 LSU ribosomal protein L21p [Prochlorococcus sp. MIT 0602]